MAKRLKLAWLETFPLLFGLILCKGAQTRLVCQTGIAMKPVQVGQIGYDREIRNVIFRRWWNAPTRELYEAGFVPDVECWVSAALVHSRLFR